MPGKYTGVLSGGLAAPRPLTAATGFPKVGKGLGGLPVRQSAPAFEVDLFVFFNQSGSNPIKVFDKTWTDVTSSYLTTQPAILAAGSPEQMWMPLRQKKYLGLGSYQVGYSSGAVVDMQAKPWTVYENYTAISSDGSGGASVRNMAPLSNGYVAGFTLGTTADEAVCNIVTKAETTGQPATFTTDSTVCMKVYGDYLYVLKPNGLFKFSSDSGGLLTLASNYSSIIGGQQSSIAVKSDDSRVYVVNSSTVYVLNSALSLVTSFSISAYCNYAECIEISPDDKWLVLGCQQSGVSGVVLVINTETLAITQMTVPAGGTSNARFCGCAWYPDSDQYIVGGYVDARSHIGRRTAGGWQTNLYAGVLAGANTMGVAIIPK